MLFNEMRNHFLCMPKLYFGFYIVIILILLPTVCNGKVFQIEKITDNETHDGGVVIEGNKIAWRGVGDNGKQSILLMELSSGQVENLTDGTITGYFGTPRLSNGQVAWRAYNRDTENPKDTIVFWDGTNVQVIDEFDSGSFPYIGYPPSYGSIEPTLSNGQIAYAKWDGNDYEIFLWDGQEITQITNNETDDYEPQIDNGQISWTGSNSISEPIDVFFWDGSATNNISNMPETNEDSHLQDGRIVYYGFDQAESYMADIFIWDGVESKCLVPILGYDYEPEIGGSLIAWTGWPYGKPHDISVCWIWDEYKLFDLTNSTLSGVDPRTDGFSIAFRAYDGDDWEIYIAKYIEGSFTSSENTGETHGLVKEGELVFIANGSEHLVIADATDKSEMEEIGTLTIPDADDSFDICKKDNYVFLASGDSGVHVVDVSDATTPTLVSTLDTPDEATTISLIDNYLYIGDQTGGLRIVDISDPQSMNEVGVLLLSGSTYGTSINGSYAYVANFSQGMKVVDISTPQSPVEVASYSPSDINVWNVVIEGSYAYLLCLSFGIKILDISDPLNPMEVGSLPLPEGNQTGQFDVPMNMVVAGPHGFVASGSQGVFVIDLSDPYDPQIVERIDTKGYAWSVELDQSYLYVSDGNEGFHIIDISDYFYSVYEDGGDGQDLEWEVYDDDPEGAMIQNVYDYDRDSYVIQFLGDGHDNGYSLLTPTGCQWLKTVAFNIEWSLKYNEFYTVYIELETSAGTRMMVYKPEDTDDLGTDTYIHHGLGTDTMDGQWHTFSRNLTDDIEEAQPDVKILSVNGFYIRGSGKVDNILLFAGQAEGYDFDNDGLTKGQEINAYQTDPTMPDTDGDGINDGDEAIYWGYSWDNDSDLDGEINLLDPDSDNDGFSDGLEIESGTDPSDSLSYPDTELPAVPAITIYVFPFLFSLFVDCHDINPT
ncbi:hypothetical protein DSCO28_64470 [Desulfosarcina ovata subsp. sediminis]|uniref:Uncharacterized protein n=1 Tax=Desulfosarcina ovata subsp. sediminis TaxID=885957 RepID=A0A5K8A0G0_9BACT|nr:hypothetical protein [Desulfosarcina ovata]BBO85881.1 hypothetical protein DSCO28_64470 [Desulfosarcina ovata subsp. sediminis]